jgi:hypothetical protein
MASPTGSGQQQTKYESETSSHGLRFAYKASRIFRARRPLKLSGRLGTLPFRLAPGTKSRQISELPNRDHTRELCPRGRPRSSHGRQSLPSSGGSLPRSGTRAKEAGTNGAGIGDAPRRAIRGVKGNPNSLRRRAAVRPWSPKRSVPRRLGAPIRDGAKEPSTNGAGISDAPRRAIRGAKGNPRFASPRSRRTVTSKVTPIDAAASFTASRLEGRCGPPGFLERLSPSSPL